MMKVMPFGMVGILISIVLAAILYAKIYSAGGDIVSGLLSGIYLGALIGLFVVCGFAIHNYVNLSIGVKLTVYEHRLLLSVDRRRRRNRPNLQTILSGHPDRSQDLLFSSRQASARDTSLTSDCRSVATSRCRAIPALWPAQRARSSLCPACCAGMARLRMRPRCSG
jgi:hypothetical protein